MPVEYLQIVSVPVSSQDRTRDYYVRGLGWDLLSDEEYELSEGQQLRWLEVRPRGGQTAITLVESTVAELVGRG
jgi:catechol 2,3-dioxygenase-like lactoylglutathione lyase family enzyme